MTRAVRLTNGPRPIFDSGLVLAWQRVRGPVLVRISVVAARQGVRARAVLGRVRERPVDGPPGANLAAVVPVARRVRAVLPRATVPGAPVLPGAAVQPARREARVRVRDARANETVISVGRSAVRGDPARRPAVSRRGARRPRVRSGQWLAAGPRPRAARPVRVRPDAVRRHRPDRPGGVRRARPIPPPTRLRTPTVTVRRRPVVTRVVPTVDPLVLTDRPVRPDPPPRRAAIAIGPRPEVIPVPPVALANERSGAGRPATVTRPDRGVPIALTDVPLAADPCVAPRSVAASAVAVRSAEAVRVPQGAR